MPGRRVTIDLTEDASAEVDRITESTGLSIADTFRHAFNFLRLYLEARDEGKELRIYDPKNPREIIRIEIPTLPRRRSASATVKRKSKSTSG